MPDNPWKLVQESPWKPVATTKPAKTDTPSDADFYQFTDQDRAFDAQNKGGLPRVLDQLRPFISAAAGGVASVAAAPSAPFTAGAGPVAAGVAGYTAADTLQKKGLEYLGIKNEDGLSGSLKDAAINEVGGKVIGKVVKSAKPIIEELTAPGSVVGKTMADLGATYSQLKESMFGKKAPVSKWIEDILASSVKAKQIEEAGTKGFTMAGGAGFNPNSAASDIQASLKSAALQSKAESNALGNKAVAIAESNPHITMKPTAGINIPVVVNGPIDVKNSVDAAHTFLIEQQKNIVPGAMMSNRDTELRKLANSIISLGESTDPTTGQAISHPISFRDAWNFKQIADEFQNPPKMAEQGTVDITPPSSLRKFYKSMSQTLNDDIDNSIPNWPNKGPEAQQAWQQAKSVVGERQALLNAKGDKLADIIDSAQTELPSINAVIADPKQLQRAVNAGKVTFPSGHQVVTNTRADLSSYKLKSILNNAWTSDPTIPGKGNINMQSVINQWNDPAFQDSKKILFGAQTRSDYDNLFKNIAITQEKQNQFGKYSKLWIARTGIMLTPALLTSHMTMGNLEHGAIVAVGLFAGGLARAMTYPPLARAMAAAAAGQPLNISQEAFARMMAKAIQGQSMNVTTSDGKVVPGKLEGSEFKPEDQ